MAGCPPRRCRRGRARRRRDRSPRRARPGGVGQRGVARARTGCGVLLVVAGEQVFLLSLVGEEKEDQRGADKDRDDAGEVRPVSTVEERRPRSRDDLLSVLWVLLGDVGGAAEGLLELVLDAVGDLRPVGGGGDRGAD